MPRVLAGDHAAALKTQLAGIELVDSLFCEVNPIPVKYALELMGFGKAVYRQPLCEPSDGGEGDDCRCHEECRHYLAQPPLSVVEGKRT